MRRWKSWSVSRRRAGLAGQVLRQAPPRRERAAVGGSAAAQEIETDGVTYAVKEIFFTLQGEGANAGRPAVFCRFAGCNLWTGREEDRRDALCQFCDTDFVGMDGPRGGKFGSARELVDVVREVWPRSSSPRVRPFVVCTGGEPLLQLDEQLV